MMDEDLTISPNLPRPSVECENRPLEEMVFPHSSSEGESTELLSTVKTSSISNSLNCVDQLKELLQLPRFSSSKSLDNMNQNETETDLFGSFENGCIDEMPSSDEQKTEDTLNEQMEIINNPAENNKFEIEETPNSGIETLSSDKSENLDINPDNNIEMKNVESETRFEETANLSLEVQSTDEMNNGDSQEIFRVEEKLNGDENEDEILTSNDVDEIVMKRENIESAPEKKEDEVEEIPDSSAANSDESQAVNSDTHSEEQVGRCVDFIKREILRLILKTSKKKYRIKKCQIHLTPVEEDGEEDDILVIEKDQIQCFAEDIQNSVRKGYDSYNLKLRKELNTVADIEYVSVDSPPGTTTKSNRTAVVQQDNACLSNQTTNQENGESSVQKCVPTGVAVSPRPEETNCKMVLQSLPPYLLKSIVESIRSFSKTDPNSKVPEYIPVQTIIPFKETPASVENNGFIVVTTGVVQRTEPIYYLSKETTLHDVFGGNVFSVVSHSLPSSLPEHGTPLRLPGVVVKPSTSPGTVATLLMTPGAAQLLQVTTATRAAFQTSSGAVALAQASPVAVVSPGFVASPEDVASQLSPGAVATPQASPGPVASLLVSPGGVATQLVSRELVSRSTETSPVVRKRGRPFGKANKRQNLSSFEDDYVGRKSPTTPESVRLKEWKSLEKHIQRMENGEHHCFKKNGTSHPETPSTSKQVKEIKTFSTMVDCDNCGISYREGTNHKCMKKKGMKTEEKRFACPECGRAFSKKAHLSNHTKTHKGYMSKTVKCEICKERFMKGNAILKHKEEFHPEILSSCDICNKIFQSHRQLEQHKKIHKKKYADDEGVVICLYCNGSFDLRHYESVHVKECSNNPKNNNSRTDGTVTVRMAKSVAVRSKPFIDGSISSDDEDHYQHVEILDEHLTTLGYYSDDLGSEVGAPLKRKRNGMHSQSESDREFEPASKQIKLKATAFRTIKTEDSEYNHEENDTDTDILSELEGNSRNYTDVEEMMNDRFSSA